MTFYTILLWKEQLKYLVALYQCQQLAASNTPPGAHFLRVLLQRNLLLSTILIATLTVLFYSVFLTALLDQSHHLLHLYYFHYLKLHQQLLTRAPFLNLATMLSRHYPLSPLLWWKLLHYLQ